MTRLPCRFRIRPGGKVGHPARQSLPKAEHRNIGRITDGHTRRCSRDKWSGRRKANGRPSAFLLAVSLFGTPCALFGSAVVAVRPNLAGRMPMYISIGALVLVLLVVLIVLAARGRGRGPV